MPNDASQLDFLLEFLTETVYAKKDRSFAVECVDNSVGLRVHALYWLYAKLLVHIGNRKRYSSVWTSVIILAVPMPKSICMAP